MELTLGHLAALLAIVADREPTIHELTAVGAYVRDVYQGLENILVRFTKFHRVDLPNVVNWHVKLVEYFFDPPHAGLPALLAEPFAAEIDEYRAFRHRFHKGYALLLRWDMMLPLANAAGTVFREFHRRVAEQITLLQKP